MPMPFAAGALAVGVAAVAVRAFLIEPRYVEVSNHALPLLDLPGEWEGARVVHLSDLHYGNPHSEMLFRWMVRTVNDHEPDLIVITGDFIVDQEKHVAPCLRLLAGLRSRRGILGVTGDHDFCGRPRRPVPGLLEGLSDLGIRMLRNHAELLPGGLRVVGVEPTTRKIWTADLDRALSPLAGAAPHLLLSHSPDIVDEAVRREVPLVLCGHSHGGQVVVPFYGPPITHTRSGRKHASGWSSRGATRMYTNRGLGTHFSLRFLCRPEVAFFRLAASAA